MYEINEKCLNCPLCVDDDEALYCLKNFVGMQVVIGSCIKAVWREAAKFKAIVAQRKRI